MKNNYFFRNLTYEFRKLRLSRLVAALALLVCVNVAGSYIYAGNIDRVDVGFAVDDYIAEPSAFMDSYAQWKKSYDLYEQALIQNAKLSAGEAKLPDPPKQIHNSHTYDERIYTRFFILLYRKENYKTQIAELIQEAEENISDSAGNSFSEFYNSEIKRIYAKTAGEVYIGLEDTRGWDIFLESSIPGLSAAVVLLFITGQMFCMEYSSGMDGVIFSSRYGRKKVLLTKIVSTFVLAFLFLAISEVSSLLTIWKTTGLSSPFNGIQAFGRYTYCPSPVSVLTYSLLSFFAKLCTLWLICLFAATLSVFLQNGILVLLVSGFTAVAAYVVLLLTPDSGSLAYRLHPLVHLTSTDFFARYSASRILLWNVDHKYFVPFVYLAAGAIMLCAVLLIRKTKSKLRFPQLFIIKRAKTSQKPHKNKALTRSLVFYELKKQLQPRTVVLCVLMIAAQTLFTSVVYGGSHSEEDNILYEYTRLLEGPVSAEKTEYLMKERADFDKLLSEKGAMESAYGGGKITTEEYIAYLNDYERALSHSDILDDVIERDRYLNEASVGKQKPACHLYDSGYENIADSGVDVLLLLTVFFIASGVFPREYVSKTSSGSSAQLINSTKRGRKPTERAKIISTFVLSSALYLITTGLRLAVLRANWYFPAIDAPVYSLQRFASAADFINLSGISTAVFFAMYFALRLAVLLLAVYVVMMITKRAKDSRVVFAVIAVWLTAAYAGDYVGLVLPRWGRMTEVYNLFM